MTFFVSCHCRVPEHENYASSLRRDSDYTPTFDEDVEDPEDFADLADEDEVESSDNEPSRRANHRRRPTPRQPRLRTLKHLLGIDNGTYKFQVTGFIANRAYVRLGKDPAIAMNGLFHANVRGQNVMIKCLPANRLIKVKVAKDAVLQIPGG